MVRRFARMMEIIFFAFLTGYLAFRLWAVLGKRTGFDGPPPERRAQPRPMPGGNVIPLPARGPQVESSGEETTASALEEELKKIQAIDPQFNVDHFLRGAKSAFRMIVGAYATADKETLKSLLSPSVFKSFGQAIDDRLEANQTVETEIVDLKDPQIITIEVKGKQELITVKFLSEQIVVTKDETGKILDNPARLSLTMKDIWTFSRLGSVKNPNWLLTATRIEGN